jgi:hypothetical protein
MRNITEAKLLEMKNTLTEMLMKIVAEEDIIGPNEV